MTQYFSEINNITYNSNASPGDLNYRFYDANKMVFGKTMAEHLKLAVCYWHNFCWEGNDAFGGRTRITPWESSDIMQQAYNKADAMFELVGKLGAPYFTFHDIDAAPEGKSLEEYINNLHKIVAYFEEKMQESDIKLLWGTANLFSHRRYQAGAATNPDPRVFAYASAQTKHALESTHRLNGSNYVVWGGREGYDTLLNTNLRKEKNNYARFLNLIVEHKHKIGFQGQLLIEPKPCEPTKHQYDHDTETVYGFLCKHGLEKEFKVNIEANHATLAGHSFEHEIEMACALDCMGSIDANRGDPQNGWDTDQFPNSVEEISLVMYSLLKHGGLSTGGFNFDSKVRRQSIDPIDMFYGHIGGIDVLAKSLLNAEKMINNDVLHAAKNNRYQNWNTKLGTSISNGSLSLDDLSNYAEKNQDPKPVSGRQEKLENILNFFIN